MTRVKPSMLPPTIITAPTSEMARPKAVTPIVNNAKRSSQASNKLRTHGPAPSDAHCSPCWRSTSSTTCRVSAATTGTTKMNWANTMALKLNIQPKKPKGPVRDSSKYTTRPTTTDGSASNVFKPTSTAPRPRNRDTASHAPKATPTP